jgi:lysozyme family protein
MPSPAFTASLRFVLRSEGGYVDHPNDSGGATNKGVTLGVYDRWREDQGLPTRSVRDIGDDEVETIYEGGYWLPPRCDLLRRRLDLVQFDTAVNMGVGRAVRFLQSGVGCDVDGAFGPQTALAAADCDLGAAVRSYCDARQSYHRLPVERRPDLGVFLNGWTNRVNALRSEAGAAGCEAAAMVDFGDAAYIAKVPDIGVDPSYDVEEH